MDNDLIEDVQFLRDDDANLVWAIESLYTDDTVVSVSNGDKERIERAFDPIYVPSDFEGTLLMPSDNLIIVASAGSGKTTTAVKTACCEKELKTALPVAGR